jgi:hypothetical protein
MLYEALVIDNKNFYSNGKIKVRIPNFYHRNMNWDLAGEYPDLLEEAEIKGDAEYSNDFEASVYSPYGGGRNFGVFFLPQINQKGLVMPIGQGTNRFVWLGSFFEAYRTDNFDVEYVNIPSDDIEQSDGSTAGEQTMDAESSADALKKNFVARFKTTNADSQEDLDWQQRPTSNIITVGDKESKVTHYAKEEKFSASMNLTEEGFNIEVDNEGNLNTFKIKNTDDGISLYFEDTEGNKMNFNKNTGFEVESVKDATFKTEGKLKFNGAGDQGVLYSFLKKIIDAFEKHIHQTPSGPSATPLNADQSPITSKTTAAKNDMKSESLELD